MNVKIFPRLVFASICFAAMAQAAVVVSFDTDTAGTGSLATRTVQQNLDLDGDLANDDSRVIRAFEDVGGSAWSTGASYTGPALYGGFVGESINVANRNTSDYGLTGSNGFYLRYQTNTGDPTFETGRLAMALLFDAGGSYSLDSSSSLRISGNGDANMARFESLGTARWLVRNGTSLYVSQSTIANNAGGRLLDGTELGTEMWALYNPTNAFAFNLGTLNFNTATSALTDLNAFGISTQKESFSSARHWLGFTEFEVNAVPEPGSLVLMGLGGLAVVVLRRRRR